MVFILGKKQVFIGFGRVGFNFFLFEDPLSNVWVLHFSLTLKHFDFHFFFEILALMMKFSAFLCGDCVTGHLAMKTLTTSEKVNWRFFGKFCHSWPCLTFLRNRVLKKSQCLFRWWWCFLNHSCIRSPSGLHHLLWTCFFSKTTLMIS